MIRLNGARPNLAVLDAQIAATLPDVPLRRFRNRTRENGQSVEFEGGVMTLGSVFRVLIVEDEILLAMELQEIIEEAGHQVVGHALDSRAACRMVEELRPDVVLLDVNLRDGPTGTEVARRIKERSNVAIVFVTANAGRLAPTYHGAIGAVDKPFTQATILSVLSYVARWSISGADAGAPPKGLRVPGVVVENGMWTRAEVA
ncbi:MAG: response regulator [Aestuariivirgaceae bacterium]